MSLKFYGLSRHAYNKIDKVLTAEMIQCNIESDDFDGLTNVEIIDHQKYHSLGLFINGHDVTLRGKETQAHFDMSECEKIKIL